MKSIDNLRNSMVSPNNVDSGKSESARWDGPEFDANKNELPKEPDASQTHSEIASSLAVDAKGILKTEGDLRRFAIDQDLNQPDMARGKKNQLSIKQQILEYPSGE